MTALLIYPSVAKLGLPKHPLKNHGWHLMYKPRYKHAINYNILSKPTDKKGSKVLGKLTKPSMKPKQGTGRKWLKALWQTLVGKTCAKLLTASNSLNKAMSQNGRTITDAEAKANIFVNHYSRASNLPMTFKNRSLIRKCSRNELNPSTDDESCSKLTLGKLISVMHYMKCKGAACPDGIAST